MSDLNNKNLSDEQKNDAMERAKKILKRMGMPLMPEAEEIMNNLLDGNMSQSEAIKKAKNVKKK